MLSQWYIWILVSCIEFSCWVFHVLNDMRAMSCTHYYNQFFWWPFDFSFFIFFGPMRHITHTRLTALRPVLPRWAGTRKVKPIWILLKQETASGSGISWAICKSAPRSRQITTPAPHHSVVLQARCPSCHPTHSIKALKVPYAVWYNTFYGIYACM